MNCIRNNWLVPLLLCGLVCLFATVAFAEERPSSPGLAEKAWIVSAGYGLTHNGMGKTQINVETVDVIVGRETFLTGTLGRGILSGRHSLVVEVPISFVVDPWEDPMIGLNFLARWTFISFQETKPYLFAGGGPLFTDAKISGLGSNVNGNYQFGLGVRFPSSFGDELAVEYRFHHISNMNTVDPNDSLNSSKLLFGVRF